MFANFHWMSALIGAAIALALALTILMPWMEKRQADNAEVIPKWLQEASTLDPWDHQRRLMTISGQALPLLPVVSKGSTMYAALLMEELAETFDGIVAAWRRQGSLPLTGDSLPIEDDSRMGNVMMEIKGSANVMSSSAVKVRNELKAMQDFSFTLLEDEAVVILDGTTDVAVVNCGFAEASALPGAAAYLEVVLSNASKANPTTGVIDKTLDGKWIKGEAYHEPALDLVLRAHMIGIREEVRDHHDRT